MMPLPTSRVARRALPPSTLRAYPVVKSLTVEAGISDASGLKLHRICPDWSAMATPHSPGAVREAEAYQSFIREPSHWGSVCAWSASDLPNRPTHSRSLKNQGQAPAKRGILCPDDDRWTQPATLRVESTGQGSHPSFPSPF